MTRTATTTAAATAADFAKWTAHAKTLGEAALRHIIADCREAEAAMRGWNPEKEGFYADQAFTYADALRRLTQPRRSRRAA